jgi:hypothetical protein
MEATGVYWKPVWHVLEGHATLVLANAMHIRNIPGRKSDTNDATWISDLLAFGLIRSSFVPPAPIQERHASSGRAGQNPEAVVVIALSWPGEARLGPAPIRRECRSPGPADRHRAALTLPFSDLRKATRSRLSRPASFNGRSLASRKGFGCPPRS